MPRARPRVPLWLLPALVALVAVVYQPVWDGGLLWDDAHHLTSRELESAGGLWRIWTEPGATQQYYPVAHTAFWIQHRLWGDDVFGYHLVNAGLHAVSSFLVAVLLQTLAVPGAIAAAFVFAAHPVNVESVAWMSELKNTLSTVLYLGAALAYVRFDERRRRVDYGAAVVLFAIALAAKTVTATLPASLLIVIWWKRGRVGRRDVLPLVPFFAFGLAAGLITAWVERHFVGAQGSEFQLTFAGRLLLAGRAAWFYAGKLAWPAGLSFVYPRWAISATATWPYLYAAAVAVALVGAWRLRASSRAPLAAMLLFLVALVPALGFVDVYPFRYSFVADHFQYLATIPAIAAVCAAASLALRRVGRAAATVVACAAVAALSVVAHAHAGDFASAERLYRATLEVNPDAWMARNNLAMILAADGPTHEAREQFMEALRIDPDVPETQMNAGRVLIDEGALPEAIEHLRAAIALDARLPDAHSNLGVALMRSGRMDDAVGEFEEALRLAPAHVEARVNLAATRQQLGVVAAQAGRMDDAIAQFEAAAHAAPDDAPIRYNLGTAYLASGRPRDAVPALEEALRLNPALDPARANLAEARRQLALLPRR